MGMETIERDERAPLAFDDEPLELAARQATSPRRVQDDLDLFAKEDDLLAELELEEASPPPRPAGRLGLIFAIGVVLVVATLGGRAALEAASPTPVAVSVTARTDGAGQARLVTEKTSIVHYELERERAAQ
jgi:hypothetical protein